MFYWISRSTVLCVLALASLLGVERSYGQVIDPEVIDVSLTASYIPTGFDSNDKAQVMVEGYLPDTCYKLGSHSVKVDEVNQKVMIQQQAYKYRGVACLLMIVPYYHIVDLGLLKSGTYSVIDGLSQRSLGKLPVAEAQTSNPDDAIYAPVTDVSIERKQDGNYELTLAGSFTDNCARLKNVDVQVESKNVITVLPKVEVSSKNCKAGEFPFKHSQVISGLAAGRYMLHVRSMNGNAVATLFNVE